MFGNQLKLNINQKKKLPIKLNNRKLQFKQIQEIALQHNQMIWRMQYYNSQINIECRKYKNYIKISPLQYHFIHNLWIKKYKKYYRQLKRNLQYLEQGNYIFEQITEKYIDFIALEKAKKIVGFRNTIITIIIAIGISTVSICTYSLADPNQALQTSLLTVIPDNLNRQSIAQSLFYLTIAGLLATLLILIVIRFGPKKWRKD